MTDGKSTNRAKAILGAALIGLIALGFSFYVLQLLYLGFLLIRAGRADTEPFETTGFRHVALGISVAAAVVAFAIFYRKLGPAAERRDILNRP